MLPWQAVYAFPFTSCWDNWRHFLEVSTLQPAGTPGFLPHSPSCCCADTTQWHSRAKVPLNHGQSQHCIKTHLENMPFGSHGFAVPCAHFSLTDATVSESMLNHQVTSLKWFYNLPRILCKRKESITAVWTTVYVIPFPWKLWVRFCLPDWCKIMHFTAVTILLFTKTQRGPPYGRDLRCAWNHKQSQQEGEGSAAKQHLPPQGTSPMLGSTVHTTQFSQSCPAAYDGLVLWSLFIKAS